MQAAEAGRLTRALRAAGHFLLRVPRALVALFLCAWLLLIWDLSSHRAPIPTGASVVWELVSNLAHAPLFGTLALLAAALCLRERDGAWPRPRAARIALVLALVVLYGSIDELHQSHVPGRDASPFDVLTDGVSAAQVLWIVYTLGRAELTERRLLARLGVGIALCVASATLALVS